MAALALRFIAGKYEGGHFVLPQQGELFIGRSVDVPICLVEDLVSRKHAKLICYGDTFVLEDLNSTNGTFINGERITKRMVVQGDRILIGTSIMRLEPLENKDLGPKTLAPVAAAVGAPQIQEAVPTAPGQSPPSHAPSPQSTASAPGPTDLNLVSPKGRVLLEGSLNDLSLGDVFKLIAQAKHTGLMIISGPQATTLAFERGALINVCQTSLLQMPADKALCRIAYAPSGPFVLYDQPVKIHVRLVGSSESLLLEASRQNDEAQAVMARLSLSFETVLSFAQPPTKKLSNLPPALLDTLQMAIEFSTVGATLDHNPGADAAVLQQIGDLMAQGFLIRQ